MRRIITLSTKALAVLSLSGVFILLTYTSLLPHTQLTSMASGTNNPQTSCDSCNTHTQQTVLYTFNQAHKVIRQKPSLAKVPYWLHTQLPLWLLYIFPFLAFIAIGYNQTRILLSVQLRY